MDKKTIATRLTWNNIAEAVSTIINDCLATELRCVARADNLKHWTISFTNHPLYKRQLDKLTKLASASEDDKLKTKFDKNNIPTFNMSFSEKLLQTALHCRWMDYFIGDDGLYIRNIERDKAKKH